MKTNKLGQIEKGNIPWNKNKKGIHLSPKSEFKKGQFVGENHSCWKGGVQRSKRDGVMIYESVGKRTRRSRLIYAKAYGEIPKGYCIYHLDGNVDNDALENLEAISRAELLKRNSNGVKNV